jgi:hypothetical protein
MSHPTRQYLQLSVSQTTLQAALFDSDFLNNRDLYILVVAGLISLTDMYGLHNEKRN